MKKVSSAARCGNSIYLAASFKSCQHVQQKIFCKIALKPGYRVCDFVSKTVRHHRPRFQPVCKKVIYARYTDHHDQLLVAGPLYRYLTGRKRQSQKDERRNYRAATSSCALLQIEHTPFSYPRRPIYVRCGHLTRLRAGHTQGRAGLAELQIPENMTGKKNVWCCRFFLIDPLFTSHHIL